jgi:hypothetical protein
VTTTGWGNLTVRWPRIIQSAMSIFLVAAGLCSAGTATADGPPGLPAPSPGEHGPASISSTPHSDAAGGPQPAAAVPMNCSIRVDNPHNSSTPAHVGTIIVKAVATCDPAIGQVITMRVDLWRVSDPPAVPLSFPGVPVVQTNQAYGLAQIPCVAGTYYGTADAVVVFPVGSLPPFGAMGNTGAQVPLTC